jgi:hypothetical protein
MEEYKKLDQDNCFETFKLRVNDAVKECNDERTLKQRLTYVLATYREKERENIKDLDDFMGNGLTHLLVGIFNFVVHITYSLNIILLSDWEKYTWVKDHYIGFSIWVFIYSFILATGYGLAVFVDSEITTRKKIISFLTVVTITFSPFIIKI